MAAAHILPRHNAGTAQRLTLPPPRQRPPCVAESALNSGGSLYRMAHFAEKFWRGILEFQRNSQTRISIPAPRYREEVQPDRIDRYLGSIFNNWPDFYVSVPDQADAYLLKWDIARLGWRCRNRHLKGGRERTKEEFSILFEKADFRITSVV